MDHASADDAASLEPEEATPAASLRTRLVASLSLYSVLMVGSAVIALAALTDLAIKSAVDLDFRWDTFMYHLPFAALRGGINLPYDMNDTMKPFFQGFPPLPDLVQGLLWRLTGSINATGVVNFIAFAIFLAYAHLVLHARFWIVALIALTAPMVLIHTTVSYVDLWSNAFLAIGVSSCLYLYLFPETASRAVVIGGLAGLAAAAWSKFQLVPIAGLVFLLFVAILWRSAVTARIGRRQVTILLLAFAMLSAAPYVKNLAVYGNPFWPTKVPVIGQLFPYLNDDVAGDAATQRPPNLKGAPQAQVFIESLFEIDVPTSYPNRPRWNEDQGNSVDGFRMGGFWGLGALVYLVITFGMLIAYGRRKGIIASLAGLGLLGFVAVLPQSNELRYYLFIPLTWAAAIGMLLPSFRARFPNLSVGFMVLMLAMFGYMVSENPIRYQIVANGYREATLAWAAAGSNVIKLWPLMKRGEIYCAVDMVPVGIMMTGPTMSEFNIVDRSNPSLCPKGAIVVTLAGIQGRIQ